MIDQIYQGDHSPIYEVKDFSSASIQGGTWQAKLAVQSQDQKTTFLTKDVTTLTADELGFAASITADESAKLLPGIYVVVIEVTDTADATFRKEVHQDIQILAQGVKTESTDLSKPVLSGGEVVVEVPFVDYAGRPITPSSGSFQVFDQDGVEIVASTALVIGADSSTTLTVTGANNTLGSGVREAREVVVKLTDASGDHEQRFVYVIESAAVLQVAVNSFQTFPQSIVNSMDLVDIPAFKAATPNDQIAALVQAYNQLAKFRYAVAGERYSVLTMDSTDFNVLPDDFKRALRQAQIVQADFLLGGNPLEQRSQDGLLAETIGESSMFLRHRTPLRLGVTRKAFQMLARYIDYGVGVGRA